MEPRIALKFPQWSLFGPFFGSFFGFYLSGVPLFLSFCGLVDGVPFRSLLLSFWFSGFTGCRFVNFPQWVS